MFRHMKRPFPAFTVRVSAVRERRWKSQTLAGHLMTDPGEVLTFLTGLAASEKWT